MLAVLAMQTCFMCYACCPCALEQAYMHTLDQVHARSAEFSWLQDWNPANSRQHDGLM